MLRLFLRLLRWCLVGKGVDSTLVVIVWHRRNADE